MLSLFRSTHPVIAATTLVGVSLFATNSVVIREGDTLSELAVDHDVSLADLMAWNDIEDPDLILSGRTLRLAAPETAPAEYQVRAGDTLSEIAARYGLRTSGIAAANSLDDPDLVLAGSVLDLRAEPATPSPKAADPAAEAAPPAPAPEPAPEAPAPEPSGTDYTVQPGDTLSQIAEQFGVSTTALAEANDITDRQLVREGATLTIPEPPAAAEEPSNAADGSTPADTAPADTAPDATAPEATAPDDTAPAAEPPSEEAAPATTTLPPAPTTTAAPGPVGPLLTPLFARWSTAYGVPQGLVEAIAWEASDWQPGAVGSDGRVGIGQLTPDTVTFVEQRLIGLDLNPVDSSDSIQMTARYLRYLLDRTGSEREAVAAWQQGLSSVQSDGMSSSAAAFADAVLAVRDERS